MTFSLLRALVGGGATHPGIRHPHEDLTPGPPKFSSVCSYVVGYDPLSRPGPVVAVLHGARDVEPFLKQIEP